MPADQDLADDLRSTAKVRPESVDVSTLVDLTTSSDDVARTIALGALKEVGSERPDRVRGSVDAIGARLSDGNASVRKNALFALVPLAEADPDVVSPYLRAIGDLLDGDKTANNAVHVFKHLSEAFPEAAGDYVDRIVPLLQADNEYTRIQAAGCLRNLARPKRETIREYVPELRGVPADAVHGWHELDPGTRKMHAPAYPDPIVDHSERREEAIAMFEAARGEDEE